MGALRAQIALSEPVEGGKFLGCHAKAGTKSFPMGGDPWADFAEGDLKSAAKDGRLATANCIEYDMESFFLSCVNKYCEVAGTTRDKLAHAATPFLDEARLDREFLDKQASAEAAGKPVDRGALTEVASGVLMKVLWGTPCSTRLPAMHRWVGVTRHSLDNVL